MSIWMHEVLLALLLLFIAQSEAATPLFLQAITSALATIPFTGGPMTTGLVGAKLGIGAKLLYYLGFFGRRSKPERSKPKPAAATQKIPLPTGESQSFSGIQPVPLPYMFSGGGGLPGMANSFQQTPVSQGFSGLDPAQLFQILTSQGVDPNIVMEALNHAGTNRGNAGFGGSGAFGANGGLGAVGFGGGNTQFGTGFESGGVNTGFGMGGFNPGFGAGSINTGFGSNGGGSEMNAGFGMDTGFSQNIQTVSGQNANFGDAQTEKVSDDEDVESFFTLMQDMDENTCISRLICDIGHNPSFLGDFSENIHSMVNSLEVQPSSRAYQYIEIMEKGRKSGNCDAKFPECSDMSYDIVKNIAPSVSLPQNVNTDAINSL